MKILAWDTSEKTQSVGVSVDGRMAAEVFHSSLPSHTQLLLPTLQEVLEASSTTLEEIDIFAVTQGPGSFTALRIGLSTVKALARVFGKPVVGVNTLRALAEPQIRPDRVVVPILDARMGEFYVAAYRLDSDSGEVETLWCPQTKSEGSLMKDIAALPGEKLLLGSGLDALPSVVADSGDVHLILDAYYRSVRAQWVGKLGETLWTQGQAVEGRVLRPLYLRVSEAERRLASKKSLESSKKDLIRVG